MAFHIISTSPFDFVLFGATGDLARRKIFSALFHRFSLGQIPSEVKIIAVARSEITEQVFLEMIRDILLEFFPHTKDQGQVLNNFLEKISYICIDAVENAGWNELVNALRPDTVRVFYLSTPPSSFGTIISNLKKRQIAHSQSRIIVEKPFGSNLDTAKALNASLSKGFEEHQIYRIDHYLGKETVQNLIALRFANALWEPLWNSKYIDHCQITVAESIGIEGRSEYYDRSGAMRDMVQNHLLQLLCLIAMEPPSTFTPDAVRDEKLKVIKALQPVDPSEVVRGQYQANADHKSYLDDLGYQNSRTESFVALKAKVANWRWSGTPFYLRTGKRMCASMSEIAIVFKDIPHSIFPKKIDVQGRNVLIIRLQPDESITLLTNIKEPGPGGMRLKNVPLDMSFAKQLGEESTLMINPYERLIMDVVRGDQTLFMRVDEVEAAWEWLDPINTHWEDSDRTPEPYDSESSGPKASHRLLEHDGRKWRDIVL